MRARFENSVRRTAAGQPPSSVIRSTPHLAADVLAATPAGQRILIQAKRYGPRTFVGSQDVQKVNGTYRDVHRCDLAVVVTTSAFTKAAAAQMRRVAWRRHWARRTGESTGAEPYGQRSQWLMRQVSDGFAGPRFTAVPSPAMRHLFPMGIDAVGQVPGSIITQRPRSARWTCSCRSVEGGALAAPLGEVAGVAPGLLRAADMDDPSGRKQDYQIARKDPSIEWLDSAAHRDRDGRRSRWALGAPEAGRSPGSPRAARHPGAWRHRPRGRRLHRPDQPSQVRACCAGSSARPRRSLTAGRPPLRWSSVEHVGDENPMPRSSLRTGYCDRQESAVFGFLRLPSGVNVNDLEREHRHGDLIGGRVGDRGRGLFEHEEPCAGDLARERLAIAEREECVAPTVHHQRR